MKIDLDLIADYFTIITSPSRWICNEPYSEEWDEKLNELMATNLFEPDTQYIAKLENLDIWIENDPYASFTLYEGYRANYRASRLTVLRAGRKLLNDRLNSK
jgi:hypothetical protein